MPQPYDSSRGAPAPDPRLDAVSGEEIVKLAGRLRMNLPQGVRDRWVESVYGESARIASRNVDQSGASRRLSWERRLDWFLTNRWTGFPTMVALLALVLWLTIEGANVPSGMLAELLVDKGHPFLKNLAGSAHLPWWLSGVLVDGLYLTTAWVISVMLPPMAIFFPLFTMLEDFGYLPRVAFNLDNLFRRAGAHGKQALTMSMGWGCNAAGVVATRVIDSPRERLIAIITNNFALCNGRWPTQILLATIFLGSLAPAGFAASIVSTSAVLGVALLGVALTFLSSWMLSRTVLKGEASTFSLELPPYRPPQILRTLYTSLIDRTLIVLWRAIVFAAPAGVVLWSICNIKFGGVSIAEWMIGGLDPISWIIGLNGVILVAYIVAIPANEIVIPTILMLTVMATGVTGIGEQGAGVMFEIDGSPLTELLRGAGWTTLTAVCLMLFSLCHNPCSTTIYTIWKETKSAKWTALATFMPVVFGVVICAAVAFVWRLIAG